MSYFRGSINSIYFTLFNKYHICLCQYFNDYFYHVLFMIYLCPNKFMKKMLFNLLLTCSRVGVKYSTCTWYLYLSTYLSVLDVLEYWCIEMPKHLYLYLYLTKKYLVLTSNFQVLFIKKCKKS